MVGSGWAIEGALNPTVLRLHVRAELTDRTIVTCPPEIAPTPLRTLLSIDGVRSLDLHRYRVRINLAPGGGRGHVTAAATEALVGAWGAATELPPASDPRAFAYGRRGRRVVAESLEMALAADEPVLIRLFGATGVAEAIAGDDLVLIRLGRMFAWDEAQDAVLDALAEART
jgi:hypothetical protein